MRRNRLPRSTQTIALVLGGLLLAIMAAPLSARPPAVAGPYYDITREVTLTGTVSSVLEKASRGMIMGSHLLLETTSGPVDVSLGMWGMQGKGALSVAAGQQVEVTGVMKTLIDKPVFVARSVKVGGQSYTLRNEHGIPLSPRAREHVGQKTARKGVIL